VLPRSAGDAGIDSDVEEIPENLNNDEPFETAGELEVEAEITEDELDEVDPTNDQKT